MEEQKAKLQGEKEKQPTIEEARELIRKYTQQRVMQHNETCQAFHRILTCLKILPYSEDRNAVIADFERRLSTRVGDNRGKDAEITDAMLRMVSMFPQPTTAEKPGESEEAGELAKDSEQ